MFLVDLVDLIFFVLHLEYYIVRHPGYLDVHGGRRPINNRECVQMSYMAHVPWLIEIGLQDALHVHWQDFWISLVSLNANFGIILKQCGFDKIYS